jgi:hypothetical protein
MGSHHKLQGFFPELAPREIQEPKLPYPGVDLAVDALFNRNLLYPKFPKSEQ